MSRRPLVTVQVRPAAVPVLVAAAVVGFVLVYEPTRNRLLERIGFD